jgi:hypothetical protein
MLGLRRLRKTELSGYSLPGFGMLAIGARGATQVRGKDGVHPEIVGQKQ